MLLLKKVADEGEVNTHSRTARTHQNVTRPAFCLYELQVSWSERTLCDTNHGSVRLGDKKAVRTSRRKMTIKLPHPPEHDPGRLALGMGTPDLIYMILL
jgi:hypothetical protein